MNEADIRTAHMALNDLDDLRQLHASVTGDGEARVRVAIGTREFTEDAAVASAVRAAIASVLQARMDAIKADLATLKVEVSDALPAEALLDVNPNPIATPISITG